MKRASTRPFGALLLGVLALAGCGRAADVALSPAETFHWGTQPISFSPPPEGWRREGQLSGGCRGIYFVKERSVGEAITVEEYYILDDRDRRAELDEVLARWDSYDDREMRRALSRARCRTDAPFTPLESEVAENVNAALDRALLARLNGDPEIAKEHLKVARNEAGRLKFTLGDVVDSVIFRPERNREPDRFHVTDRQDATVAGLPALRVDYTFQSPERLLQGREVYVVCNSKLFAARFIGLKENLALFDRVVASIAFPDSAAPTP